jgi:hypothetical protein
MPAVSEDTGQSAQRATGQSLSISSIMFFLGFALTSFLLLGSLMWHFGNDQAYYAYVGDTVIRGGIPYRDAWDLKGPLTYYIYGWTRDLLGRSDISIRILDLTLVLFFSFQLRLFVLRLNGHRTFGANLALLLFLIEYLGSGYGYAAEPDEWGGMLVLLAVSGLILDSQRHPYFRLSIAAFILAVAVLLKPTFATFTPLVLFYPTGRKILSLENAALRSLGFLFIAIPVLASYAYVFRHGGWKDLVDALRFVQFSYGSLGERLSLQTLLHGLRMVYDLGLTVPYTLALVGLWIMSLKSEGSLARILGMWFALSVIMLVLQGVYWQYEFLPITISTAVIIGVTCKYSERWAVTPLRRYVWESAIFMLLGTICLAPFISNTYFAAVGWPAYIIGHENRSRFAERINLPQEHRYALERITQYISSHTLPNDRIQIWGWEVSALTHSKRRAASRFPSAWPMFSKTPMQSYYRKIFMTEISRSMPKCIIVDTRWYGDSIDLAVGDFPEFDHFLQAHYMISHRQGEFQVWTLKQSV